VQLITANNQIRASIALWVCLLPFCGPAAAGGLVVITDPAVTLSPNDVRDVYLGEKLMAGSVTLVPVDNLSAQPMFLSKVIKLDAIKYATAWTKRSFRDGRNLPTVRATDSEVIDFVKRTPGGIGYVTSAPAAGVTVVKLQ
jgi:hypothetical protein